MKIKNENEIGLMKDLIEHYEKKGYLLHQEADDLYQWHKWTGLNPFTHFNGLSALAMGLRRVRHFPHAISHRLVDKPALEHIFSVSGKYL